MEVIQCKKVNTCVQDPLTIKLRSRIERGQKVKRQKRDQVNAAKREEEKIIQKNLKSDVV